MNSKIKLNNYILVSSIILLVLVSSFTFMYFNTPDKIEEIKIPIVQKEIVYKNIDCIFSENNKLYYWEDCE